MDFASIVIIAFSRLFLGFTIYVDYHAIKLAKCRYEKGDYTIALMWLALASFLSYGYIFSLLLAIRACGWQ